MSAQHPKPRSFLERRRKPRFPVRQSVTVKWPDPGVPSWGGDPEVLVQPATSRDISAAGVFFWIQRPPARGTKLQVVMQAPPEMAPGELLILTCLGRVVRIESDLEHEQTGVAVEFERVEASKRVP